MASGVWFLLFSFSVTTFFVCLCFLISLLKISFFQHTLLAGNQATDFAVAMGFPLESLSSPASLAEWQQWQEQIESAVQFFGKNSPILASITPPTPSEGQWPRTYLQLLAT